MRRPHGLIGEARAFRVAMTLVWLFPSLFPRHSPVEIVLNLTGAGVTVA